MASRINEAHVLMVAAHILTRINPTGKDFYFFPVDHHSRGSGGERWSHPSVEVCARLAWELAEAVEEAKPKGRES